MQVGEPIVILHPNPDIFQSMTTSEQAPIQQILTSSASGSSPLELSTSQNNISKTPFSNNESRLKTTILQRIGENSGPAAIFGIVLLNLICYFECLDGYFFADDFVHISYLYDVFHGHAARLLENFTGNWMQASGTQFYRPLITLTLAWDYWLGGGSPIWFHLSNLVFQTGCSVFLFLTCRRLSAYFTSKTGTATAFVAAALFSVFPIHVEVVNWVIGRVDSVCLFFFLASTWLYLRSVQNNSRWTLAGAIACFMFSLMSKEPAVVLPPLLVLFELFRRPEPGNVPFSFGNTINAVFRKTWLFWLVLACYFAVRTAALGTLVGGYTGSVGEGFNQSLWQRLIESGSIQRIFLPFNAELFAPTDKLRKLLSVLYWVVAGTAFVRCLVFRRLSAEWRPMALSAVWAILCLVPVLQVFNITDTLQCSRFAYAATAPLCILLALALVPFGRQIKATGDVTNPAALSSRSWSAGLSKNRLVHLASVITATTLMVTYACIACRNNGPWQRAADMVKGFRTSVQREVSQLPPDSRIAVLNVPDRLQGAHMIYNGAMLSVLLSEPLTVPSIYQRVLNFEPVTYGDSNLLQVSRLRDLVAGESPPRTYWWNLRTKQLVPLNLTFARRVRPQPVIFSPAPQPELKEQVCRFTSTPLNLPALSYDFLHCKVKCSSSATGKGYAQLFWCGELDDHFSASRCVTVPMEIDDRSHDLLFTVSPFKTWNAEQKIHKIRLDFAGQDSQGKPLSLFKVVVGASEFETGESMIPLFASFNPPGVDGIVQLNGECRFKYDVSNIAGAQGCVVEVSPLNSWFEHYSGTMHDQFLSPHAARRITLKNKQGTITFTPKDFASSGYYQIRVAGTTGSGTMTGFTSDPVNLQVSH